MLLQTDVMTGGAAADAARPRHRALAAFAYRDFRVLLLSTMALQVGSWVQTIGMGWLVLHDLGGSATDLGLVALLRGASLVVLSPVGGFLAGRFERRRQLLLYTGGSAVVAALLAVLITTGTIEIWMVYATACLAGCLEALAGPIRSLLVFGSVAEEDLTNAVALNSLGGNAMRVIGPAIGGALIGGVGTEGTFELQAACLVLAVVLTWQLRENQPEAELREPFFASIGAGLRYVAADRAMLVIVLMGLLPSLLVYPYVTFLPVFARDVLGSNESGYGYLAAAVGLGSLFGGAMVAFRDGNGPKGRGMVVACFLYCASVAAFALTKDLWLAVAALAVAGVFHSIYAALQAALMQLRAEPAFRSRVLSLQTMMWGTTPFAALLMGRMIDAWGAPAVVFAFMVAASLVSLAIGVLSRELRRI